MPDVGGELSGDWGYVGNLTRGAVLGGTASVVGGGKFANGAETASFAYVFNDALERAGTRLSSLRQQCSAGAPAACTAASVIAQGGDPMAQSLVDFGEATAALSAGAVSPSLIGEARSFFGDTLVARAVRDVFAVVRTIERIWGPEDVNFEVTHELNPEMTVQKSVTGVNGVNPPPKPMAPLPQSIGGP